MSFNDAFNVSAYFLVLKIKHLFVTEVIPDALKTECSKCNDIQRNKVRKIMHHLIEKKYDWYKELEAAYDPEGTFKRMYDEQAKKEGLKL